MGKYFLKYLVWILNEWEIYIKYSLTSFRKNRIRAIGWFKLKKSVENQVASLILLEFSTFYVEKIIWFYI
jgi:hypothetical protein